MKRIIDGATYNTDTATEIAKGSYRDDSSAAVTESVLYQTRTGVYFQVEETTTQYRDRRGEVQTRTEYDWHVVGDANKARDWCEEYGLTITRDIEDMPDEPELGEKMATIYVRLPPSLKDAITARAEAKKVSTNVFALRCLEECEARQRGPSRFWNDIGALEQVTVDPATVWDRFQSDDVEGWKELSGGWKAFHREKLDSLIGKLSAVLEAYPAA